MKILYRRQGHNKTTENRQKTWKSHWGMCSMFARCCAATWKRGENDGQILHRNASGRVAARSKAACTAVVETCAKLAGRRRLQANRGTRSRWRSMEHGEHVEHTSIISSCDNRPWRDPYCKSTLCILCSMLYRPCDRVTCLASHLHLEVLQEESKPSKCSIQGCDSPLCTS